ncbi:hypothetical protein [Lentilactobacillus hilgardii]|uniref:hypothetical protein n=1 Tax=Lentilactobacillus hilgardii TaxID=1588 RepID=UPI003FA5E798
MAYDLAKVTANGNNLIAQILANKSSLSIDKIEISDTQLSSTTDISTMTSVPKVVQTVSANGFSKNSNTLIISTVVDNSSISADYKAWVFGIWGSDSQNGQSQLIAVITSTNSPDTIPAFSGSTPVSYTYKFNIGFSNASQIQFNMIDDSFATNDTVVHTTGDETIDGQKKFDTDPTDGAGNAYAKTVDVNQQLDKKVNVSDMRKPASDVAGIEEVSALQTQVDNSAVGTNLLLGTSKTLNTVTNASNWNNNIQSYQSNLTTVNSDTPYTARAWISPASHDMNLQIVWKDSSGNTRYGGGNSISAGTSGYSTWTGIITASSSIQYVTVVFRKQQSTASSVSYCEVKLERGSHATDWCPNPEDKVNVSDMRKPASDVAGIEEVNTKQDKLTITPADDSKVAHLSGANNFDTTPTVNHNPLLLASSLPSDLARTGSDQEFTGKNTFDTAPVDKTTGNPYITKDGVPSDVARTGQAQTFTAEQTFSIAPVINDASTDKGDNQAATMADLKSVENSAWHTVTGSSEVFNSYTMLFRINSDEQRLEVILWGTANTFSSNPDHEIIDLSSIITGISGIDGHLNMITTNSNVINSTPIISGVTLQADFAMSKGFGVMVHAYTTQANSDNEPFYVYYDDLQDAYK